MSKRPAKPGYQHIAFVASDVPEAQRARQRLVRRYGDATPEDADVVVALGGDGLMLATLQRFMNSGKPIYGMHRGTVGFLMNEFAESRLSERLTAAHVSVIHPLIMRARDAAGRIHRHRAINEVSLFRQSYQAARLRILIDGEERLIATMSGTLFALFEKRRIDMEIRAPQEFLRYFGKIHQRTMNIVGAIPPGKVDWGFRLDKFTLGDVVRHIAASNRYIFLEVAKGNRSSYHGCGKEYGASYDEIVAFTERLHREAIETFSHFTAEDLQRRCTTPDGASIPVWKWLRSMVEHEIHHRGQIYIYLSLLETPAPPIYGLTSEQVYERSIRSF